MCKPRMRPVLSELREGRCVRRRTLCGNLGFWVMDQNLEEPALCGGVSALLQAYALPMFWNGQDVAKRDRPRSSKLGRS